MGWRPPNFPTEEPEINPDDKYEDPVKLIEYREWALRRKNIEIEKAKLLREKVNHCYVTEGVNHYANCRELVARYMDAIKNVGVHVANAGKADLGRAELEAAKRAAE